MWCALGIAALVKGELTVHTRIGGEKEPVQVGVVDGVPLQTGLFGHFADPPRKAWETFPNLLLVNGMLVLRRWPPGRAARVR